ncbi:hypothetical protein CesoFtcFv8_006754 [Champsocephalus esox]|uniref:Uncharacterized protein n=1 Tax=Champsocephalus esox TaxID=159716 RepID=A0AAN8HA99_9TELE|nr:hypothetical protein CesoFtcFv8_006754 [Champsocephalus esox]
MPGTDQGATAAEAAGDARQAGGAAFAGRGGRPDPDPDPRGVDRTWVVLEADQRITTGQNSFRISGITTWLTTASLA